jgi:SAM-dependent methyltransferase
LSRALPAEGDRLSDAHDRFFATWSRFYERTPLLTPLLRRQQDHALRRLDPRPGERILDLGCGPGRGLRELRARQAVALGLDPSGEMALAARELAPVVRASALGLPLRSGSLQGLLCTNSFHHHPDAQGSLREMRRVLAPGGRAVLVDPNLDHPASRLLIYGGEALLFGMGVHLHSGDEWRGLCLRAGFSSCEVEPLAMPGLGLLLAPLRPKGLLGRLPGLSSLGDPAAVSLCVVARA